MNDQGILDRVLSRRRLCGKCSKYSGALTTEILRDGLRGHGIITSSRDVFIQGINIEFDLLVPKPGVTPDDGVLYQPEDVLAAFEIKAKGAFGENTLNSTRRVFEKIREKNPDVYCAYVTLCERETYRWKVTKEALGFDAYTLFWHYGTEAKPRYEPTGDWERLVEDMRRELLRTRPAGRTG